MGLEMDASKQVGGGIDRCCPRVNDVMGNIGREGPNAGCRFDESYGSGVTGFG
jgi:hypothetical protein